MHIKEITPSLIEPAHLAIGLITCRLVSRYLTTGVSYLLKAEALIIGSGGGGG